MEKKIPLARVWLATALLLSLLVTGCSGQIEKGRKPSQDWSRGLPLGGDAISHASLSLNPEGERLYIAWPTEEEDGTIAFRFVVLDQNGEIILDRKPITLQGMVRSLQLVTSGDDHLQLFWAGRASKTENWVLWYVEMDDRGELIHDPVSLTETTTLVGSFIAAPAEDGKTVVVWEDLISGGLHWSHILPTLEEFTAPEVLVQEGERPSLRIDSEGDFHFSWVNGDRILYEQFNDNVFTPIHGTEVASLSLGTGVSLYDPVIGLSQGWVYIFWSILNQSGLEAGTASTEYTSFPLGAPEFKYPSRIGVLDDESQPYQPYGGIFRLTQLVPAIDPIISADYVYEPVTAQTYQPELPFAVSAQQLNRLDLYGQIAIGIMADGQMLGYAFCSKTPDISGDVVLAADKNGNLHVVWRDGYQGNRVFYATTSLEARENIDGLEFLDALTVILTGGLEAVTGIMLFPLAIPWMIAGLVILVVWRLVRNDETLANGLSRLLLLLSLCLYQGSKVLIMPTILDYVPFSAWIDLPQEWHLRLRLGYPLASFAISIAVAELLRRKFSMSTLTYYVAIVCVDSIFTLAIYGVNFLGAY